MSGDSLREDPHHLMWARIVTLKGVKRPKEIVSSRTEPESRVASGRVKELASPGR